MDRYYDVRLTTLPKDKRPASLVGCEVSFVGVNWSNGGKPLVIVAANEDYVAIRHPGGSCWAGIASPRSSIAVHLQVYRIFWRGENGLKLVGAIEVPVRRPKPNDARIARTAEIEV